MKKLNLLFSLFFVGVLAMYGQFTVTTVPPLNGGNGNAGVTFGLTSTQTILIDTIFATFNTAGLTEVWVTTTDLTGPPNITTANGWTNLGGASVVAGTTVGNVVPIPLNYGYTVLPGVSYRFYVNGSLGASVAYTTGTAGVAAPFTDGIVTIETGNLVGYGGALPNPGFHPRQFNGAIKYSILGGTNDAAVASIDAPGVYCSGAQPVTATIANYGANQIDSVNVVWEVNGIVQGTVTSTTLLDTLNGTGSTTTQVSLGTFTFPAGLNDLRVWTSMPNGVADTSNFNDTAAVVTGPALTGTFTLDASLAASSTNYTSFSALSTALNTFGVCGPVTVTVAPGVYTESFALANVNGASSVNTITIDGVDSSLVTLSHDGSSSYGTVSLDATSYVTIRNMRIEATSATTGATVLMANGSDHITIENNELWANPNTTNSFVNNVTISGSTTTRATNGIGSYNTVQNNLMTGGYYGFYYWGPNTPGTENSGNVIHNNVMDSIYYYGIFAYYQDSMVITNNTVDQFSRGQTQGDGLYLYYSNNYNVSQNYMHAHDYGMYFYNFNQPLGASRTSKSLVSNNMVISETDFGMYFLYDDSVDVFFNSVATYGSLNPAVQFTGNATNLIDDYDVRNNIFYSTNTEALEVTGTTDTIFIKLDNNAYYTTGTNLFTVGGIAYADLVAYQAASPGFNAGSLEGDPQFASSSNLHIVGAFVNNVGDNSVPVMVDIDGDTRPFAGSTIVDIGADEFDPPLCPPAANLRGANLTSNSIDVVWDGVAMDYEYEVVPSGAAIGSGTSVATTSDSVLVTGLNSSTSYDFNVREICGRGDTSIWLTYSFNTLIAGPRGVNCITGNSSFLANEEFDVQGGWTGNIGTGAGNWVINSGGTGSLNTGPLAAHSGANYIYYEASGGAVNAKMVSPAIDLTGASDSAEMSFWIHAFGADMGVLNVGVSTSPTGPFATVFTQNGQLQTASADPFQQVGIRVDTMAGRIFYVEFDYTDGPGFTGDMSIDLFQVNSCISCAAPNALVDSNLTSNSVDLAWNQNGTVLGWELEYGAPGFTLGTGTRVAVASTPYSLTGLSAITNYDWYVRSICAVGDTSIWVSSQFQTPCAPFNAPYYTGFEGMTLNQNADCWSDANTNYATANNVWVRGFTGVNGPFVGTQALYIYPQSGWNSATDTLAAITPQFPDLTSGTKRIRFDANTDDAANVQLIVGTVNTPGLGGVFTPVDTLTFAANDVYANYLVEFTTANGYNGTDEYIYLAHNLGGTLANFDYIRIDEFRYEEIPSCVRPSNLSSANPTLTSVDLDWTENNMATTWEVSYGPVGFAAGVGTQVIATAKPYNLAGLTASNSYDYYVRSICAPGDSSFWEGPLTFSTANAVPYFQDFDGFGNQIAGINFAGWTNSSGATAPDWSTGGNTGSGGTGPAADHTTGSGTFAYLETSGGVAGDDDTLFSPFMLVPNSAGPLTMSFWYHMHGVTMGQLEVYLDSLGTLIPLDTIVGQQHPVQTDPWLLDSLPINGSYNGSSIRFVFVGVRGTSFTGDMAIDDFSVDFTVGVKDVAAELSGVSVSPNPSNGLFNLNIETAQNENFNVKVLDAQGRQVYTANFNVNGKYNNSLDFTSFAKGIYYMQIQTETESKVEKLIIQ